jgi:hypothetical protein
MPVAIAQKSNGVQIQNLNLKPLHQLGLAVTGAVSDSEALQKFCTDIEVLFFDIIVFTILKSTDIVVFIFDIEVSTISYSPDIKVFQVDLR